MRVRDRQKEINKLENLNRGLKYLKHTGHKGEATGNLHDSRGGAGRLENGSIRADAAAGRDGGQVVGDGKRSSGAHLHGGGGGGYRGLGAAR